MRPTAGGCVSLTSCCPRLQAWTVHTVEKARIGKTGAVMWDDVRQGSFLSLSVLALSGSPHGSFWPDSQSRWTAGRSEAFRSRWVGEEWTAAPMLLCLRPSLGSEYAPVQWSHLPVSHLLPSAAGAPVIAGSYAEVRHDPRVAAKAGHGRAGWFLDSLEVLVSKLHNPRSK